MKKSRRFPASPAGAQHGTGAKGREAAAESGVAPGTREPGPLFASASLSLTLVAAAALLAVLAGVVLPVPLLKGLLAEGGLVENATVFMYATAIVAVWLVKSARFDRASAAACTVVLFACVAREISLRRWIAEASNGAFNEASALLAIIVMAALAVASVLLVRRHAAAVWRGLRQRNAVAATLFAILCAITISQLFDRLPALLGGHSLPMRPALVALSVEETLELLIPLLVIVAAVQARAASRRSA